MTQKRAKKAIIEEAPKKVTRKGSKRQKVAHDDGPLNILEAQKQKKRGILERVADVPVDILCEILSHLSPKDLLSLTKTSRDLEAFLLDDAYLSIWRQARTIQEPQLPPLPRGFTEYEYINLVFDTHCHECDHPSAKTVLWAAKVRLCGRCFDDEEITSFAMPSWVDPILEEASRHVNPKFFTHGWGRRKDISHSAAYVWYLDGADELVAQLEELKQAGNDTKIQEWLNEKRAESEDGVKLCRALDQFVHYMHERRYKELGSLRRERKRTVIDRLCAAGWKEELAYGLVTREILSDELVDQPKVLTDKAWEDMQPKLIKHLEKRRAEMQKKSRDKVVNERLRLFSEKYQSLVEPLSTFPGVPPSNDVVRYTPFKELIFDTPLDEVIEPAQMDNAFQQFDTISDEWRKLHEATLKEMLVESGQSDDSNLAVNTFQCETCSVLVNYPNVLVHFCYRSRVAEREAADLERSSSMKSFYRIPYEWTRRQLERVIIACGLDPISATTRAMDKLDVFLYCVPCSKAGKWRKPDERASRRSNPSTFALRWNDAAAIPHVIHDESKKDSVPSWAILQDISLLKAVRSRDLRRSFGGHKDRKSYVVMCLHCDHENKYVREEMKEHLLTAHGIVTPHNEPVYNHYRPHVGSDHYKWSSCYVVQPLDEGIDVSVMNEP